MRPKFYQKWLSFAIFCYEQQVMSPTEIFCSYLAPQMIQWTFHKNRMLGCFETFFGRRPVKNHPVEGRLENPFAKKSSTKIYRLDREFVIQSWPGASRLVCCGRGIAQSSLQQKLPNIYLSQHLLFTQILYFDLIFIFINKLHLHNLRQLGTSRPGGPRKFFLAEYFFRKQWVRFRILFILYI